MDNNEAVDYQEKLSTIQDPENLLKLIFMYELSHIVMRTQKQSQDQQSLPPDRKQKVEQLISQLRASIKPVEAVSAASAKIRLDNLPTRPLKRRGTP